MTRWRSSTVSDWDRPPLTFLYQEGQRTTSYGYCGTLAMSEEDKERARQIERKRREDGWHFGFVSNSSGSSDS